MRPAPRLVGLQQVAVLGVQAPERAHLRQHAVAPAQRARRRARQVPAGALPLTLQGCQRPDALPLALGSPRGPRVGGRVLGVRAVQVGGERGQEAEQGCRVRVFRVALAAHVRRQCCVVGQRAGQPGLGLAQRRQAVHPEAGRSRGKDVPAAASGGRPLCGQRRQRLQRAPQLRRVCLWHREGVD